MVIMTVYWRIGSQNSFYKSHLAIHPNKSVHGFWLFPLKSIHSIFSKLKKQQGFTSTLICCRSNPTAFFNIALVTCVIFGSHLYLHTPMKTLTISEAIHSKQWHNKDIFRLLLTPQPSTPMKHDSQRGLSVHPPTLLLFLQQQLQW